MDERADPSPIQLLSWFFTMNILKQLPPQAFQITQLASNVVIGDRLGGDRFKYRSALKCLGVACDYLIK